MAKKSTERMMNAIKACENMDVDARMEGATKEVRDAYQFVKYLRSKSRPTPADWIKLTSLIRVCYHHDTEDRNSKLDGGCSISTSSHNNSTCVARFRMALKEIELFGATDIICAYCYSEVQTRMFRNQENTLILNREILSYFLIPEKYLAGIDLHGEFGRIEAFGDTDNVIQARNYIRIIRSHPDLDFAIWSKNPFVWAQAFKLEGGKPRNTTYVHSALRINGEPYVPDCIADIADHIFIVDDNDHGQINCGGRKCRKCKRCYKRCRKGQKDYEIHEMKK